MIDLSRVPSASLRTSRRPWRLLLRASFYPKPFALPFFCRPSPQLQRVSGLARRLVLHLSSPDLLGLELDSLEVR